MRKEAIQCAAMCVRFIRDITDGQAKRAEQDAAVLAAKLHLEVEE